MITLTPEKNSLIQGLKGTQTEENIMRAFAGESQARNRYTFAAEKAKKAKLHVIEAVFQFTASQELAHAKVFYDFLKDSNGGTIFVDGGYPVELYEDMYSLLSAAQHDEYQEHDEIYKNFGEIAEREGFAGVAQTFKEIAKIEKSHGSRFGQFAQLVKESKLFVSDVSTGFVCLNCGHVYTGTEVPEQCPVCKHDRGFFIRAEMLPYGAF
ncbi:Rubrerythrin [bioreactor metagenome]|uniref:Rubrerythrin n=1 Tax=bioreactor metagenome TaxID=1076179 RepID=A0A645ELK1_9ZZZZ|nr:ferritin family protein [Candidatus Metalachnospira sp.]